MLHKILPTAIGITLLYALAVGDARLPVAAAAEPIQIAEYKQDGDVDFQKQVLPILRRKCLACHNGTDAESDLVLESPQTIGKGGSLGPAVVAGNSGESLLLKVAAHLDEPYMPPEDNEVGAVDLTPEELGLLKLWIDQGAKGEVRVVDQPIQWQPLPPGVNPVYTVAVSDDGQFAAAGRANQIHIYHLPSKRAFGRLTDTELLKQGTYTKPGVAHLDLVQSLAFHPSGELLASGGFRTVKLWRRLRNQQKQQIEGLEGSPQSIATSSDGTRLAVGLENGSIKIFDLAAGKLVATLSGHDGPVTAVSISRDGRLASGGRDKKLRVWNIDESKELFPALETPSEINAVAWVAEGQQIAVGGNDNIIRTWQPGAEPAEGESSPAPIKQFNGHGGPVTSVVAVGNGSQFISGSQDGSIRLWDTNGGNQIRQMNHGGPVQSVAARGDGKRFVSVSSQNTLKLWNAENGQQVQENKGDFHTYLKVEELKRAVDLAKRHVELTKKDLEEAQKRKSSEEENAKKAEEERKKAEEELNKKTEAAKQPIADKEAADKALVEAEAAKQKAEAELKAAPEAITKAEEALRKAQQALDEATKALTAATEAAEQAKQKLQQAQDAAQQQPDNQELADAQTAAQEAADQAEKVRQEAESARAAAEKNVAEATTARQQAEENKKNAEKAVNEAENQRKQAEDKAKKAQEPAQKATDEMNAAQRTLEAAQRSVERAAQAVKTASDAVPAAESVVQQCEQQQKQEEGELETATKATSESEKPLWSVAFSHDGTTIAAVGDSQLVYTYDGETGSPLETYSGQNATLKLVAFDGQNDIVSVGADNSIVVWNAAISWQLERVIGGIDKEDLVDRVTALDFSSNGQILATGSGEPSRSGQIKLWNVADGTLIRELTEPHSDTVFSLDFSPDDTQLLSCAADRFIKLFNVADGSFVRAFEGHTHHVLGVSWSADGRKLASSGADSVVKVWDARTGDQLKTISGFNKEVTAIRFISNRDEFVASSGDRSVQMKRADGGNIRSLSGGEDFMYSVDVTDDGKTVIAGGQDSVVRVWSSENGQSVATFAPQSEEQQN